jgi:hypothetical protein
VPRQPWGKALSFLRSKDFTAAHLDRFMQLGAGGASSLAITAGWLTLAIETW